MEEPTLTVAELSAGIAHALAGAYPDQVWVRGEIRDLTRAPSGHVYFSLLDADGPESGEAPALLPVTLFADDRRAVNRLLVRSGALRMTDGVAVRIRGWVRHYAARGTVQLRMTWIDTDYTMGRLAAERSRLLRRLGAEGLLGRNAALPLPPVPLRVGLLTSAGSAAAADFGHALRRGRYAWSLLACDARVQGPEAPASLAAGIAALQRAGVDVIAVVRGGGAATDLAAFDDERVARAIANATVPVFTGIGHEVDRTVADEVAARAFPTPTACAAALVELVAGYLAGLDRLGRAVGRAAVRAVRRHDAALAARSRRVAGAAGAAARVERSLAGQRVERLQAAAAAAARRTAAQLASHQSGVTRAARRAVHGARSRLDAVAPRVAAQDPARLLARGWSITRRDGGEVVRRPSDVAPGDRLATRVAGGTIGSVVADIMPVSDDAERGNR